MSKLQVSVIMPVHDRDWCVAEAVESVMAIAHPLELLVVDDGSRDATPAVLDKLHARYSTRMRILRHPGGSNRGVSASRNLAISEARGEFIAFLDSDDWFLPNRFDQSLAWMRAHPQIMVGIEPYETDQDGVRRAEAHLTHLANDAQGRVAALSAMLAQNLYWTVPVATVRRDGFARFGAFNPQLHLGEDTALWLRMAAAKVVGVVQSERPVARVRRHQRHSWSGLDQERSGNAFLAVILDATRWAHRRRHAIAAPERDLLHARLRSYLIETLARPGSRGSRLRAWWRASLAAPSIVFDRAVAANLGRRLLQG